MDENSKSDYVLGSYRKGRFTPIGSSKSVKASLAESSDSIAVEAAEAGETLLGSFENGVFTPYPSAPSDSKPEVFFR